MSDPIDAGAGGERFLPPDKHPACPTCRTPLAEAAAVRVLVISDVQAGHGVRAQVVYCQVCGLALGVLAL